MMDGQHFLADKLFPGITDTPCSLAARYPPRGLGDGAMVTRLAPSPTGELHIGTLYAAFLSFRLAEQTGGMFYLRLDDTDGKRESPGSRDRIPATLRDFGIAYREGYYGGALPERGAYGPYTQQARAAIYHAFARDLVLRGLAYPCFCTAQALDAMREAQRAQGAEIGYGRKWAYCRNLDVEEACARLDAARPWILRFRAPEGAQDSRVMLDDLFKGAVSLPDNTQDIVLIKSDGLPTYHFAHAIDDFLMRTTHVLRGDEWLPSYPLHRQLFMAIGQAPPRYGHLAPIVKQEGAAKRKYSKRRDADGHALHYLREGYPPLAMREYYMRLINSPFEDWRRTHPLSPLEDYRIDLSRFSVSGAVFDLHKLAQVSRDVIAQLTPREALDALLAWAARFDPAAYALYSADTAYTRAVLSIGRGGQNPRKDVAKWTDVQPLLGYFWDEWFDKGAYAPDGAAQKLLHKLQREYDPAMDKDHWFAWLKAAAQAAGYAPDRQTYAQAPEPFAGTMADAAAAVRLALTGRENAPDLYDIMQVMGEKRVLARLGSAQV